MIRLPRSPHPRGRFRRLETLAAALLLAMASTLVVAAPARRQFRDHRNQPRLGT
ncbi:hypothetical protein ACWEPC_59185 [Nonomuraea sp. NPDC004297]